MELLVPYFFIVIICHSGAGKGVLPQAFVKSLGWKFINADVLGCAAHIGRTVSELLGRESKRDFNSCLTEILSHQITKENISFQIKEMIFFAENSIQVESQKIGKEYNINMLIPITNFCYNMSHSEFFNEIYTSDLKLFDNRDNLEF